MLDDLGDLVRASPLHGRQRRRRSGPGHPTFRVGRSAGECARAAARGYVDVRFRKRVQTSPMAICSVALRWSRKKRRTPSRWGWRGGGGRFVAGAGGGGGAARPRGGGGPRGGGPR